MLAEPEQIGPELVSLRHLGVRLALDDVGTGYSSLAQIASLPIDAVKIDRSLVVAADGDGGIARVLGSVAELGRSLDLDVIAEGIETTGQLTAAVRSGCTFVQGYLLARPMPFRELEAYATDGVIRRSAPA
jgi:EAL domain-containing protein (putative c-di-GMP-specific phosphodiesterase class I)